MITALGAVALGGGVLTAALGGGGLGLAEQFG